jgi:hypothetical protein
MLLYEALGSINGEFLLEVGLAFVCHIKF